MRQFKVQSSRFKVEGNQHFIRHCEEARRSNPLIILLNELLFPPKGRDRNDDSTNRFRLPSNYSILTTNY
jgi:hypothetical protein